MYAVSKMSFFEESDHGNDAGSGDVAGGVGAAGRLSEERGSQCGRPGRTRGPQDRPGDPASQRAVARRRQGNQLLAGRKIDQATQQASEQLRDAAKETNQKLDQAANTANQKLNQATDEAGKKLEQAGERMQEKAKEREAASK